MKKVLRLRDLDCAACAAKMECAVKKLDGVQDASVSFMRQSMTIEAPDDVFADVVERAAKVCKKIEPDCVIVR